MDSFKEERSKMFNGSSVASNDKLRHASGSLQAFGQVRGQTLSSEDVRTNTLYSTTANFVQITSDVLTVNNSFEATSLILNDGDDSIVIGTDTNNVAGSESIVIGTGTGGGDNSISIGLNNVITPGSDYSIIVGFGSTSDNTHNIIIGRGATYGNEYSILIGFQTYATGTSDNSVVIGRNAYTKGLRSVVVGYSGYVGGNESVSIGSNSSAAGTNSVAIGSNIATRLDNEFATSGMRVIRVSGTTTDAVPTAPVTVFSFAADGEIATIDGAVTAMRTNAIPVGSEAVTWKFENFHARQEFGLGAVLHDGATFSNDPDGKLYQVSLSASGNDIQIVFTGEAANDVSWVGVFRVWCAPNA